MGFNCDIPANELRYRVEPVEFLFKQPEPSFDFSVGLRVFYPGNDVVDIVLFEELLERMLRVIAVPSRDELGTMVGEDLPGSSIFSESLVQNSNRILCRG